MACQSDFASLPLLSGCPADTEWFLVGNAAGGLDANGNFGLGTIGYARRLWGDLRKCAVATVKFMPLDFIIGQPGCPMSVGDVALTLTFSTLGITGILQDSVFITLGGTEMQREDTTELSYGVVYNPDNVVINFLAPVEGGQKYFVHYAYTQ